MKRDCTGSSNAELIDNLIHFKRLSHPSAIFAMRAIDRGLFVTPEYKSRSYEDHPLPIGFEVTISAPHMHARMLDLMAPRLGPGTSALDVGSGTGYIVACMAKMGAKAYGIEHIAPLVERSIATVSKILGPDEFEIVLGDGRLGWPDHAPFNIIHVGAAAQPEVVQVLMKQLKPSGMLIIPVEDKGTFDQTLYTYEFGENGTIKQKCVCGVVFVPLKDAPRLKQ